MRSAKSKDQARIDEFVAQTRLLTGQTIDERAPWNTIVTADAIRHFAYGISDDNPLWLDADYAAQSRYGRLVAPPSFLTSVLYPMLHGAPLVVPLASLIVELEFRWFQPILFGDELRARAKQKDLFEAKNRDGRRLVYIVAETTYWNQRDEVVGRALGTMSRVAKNDDKLLADRPAYSYREEELAEVRQTILAESRRGARAFDAGELEAGQTLPPFVRGPLTIGDLICWQAGIGPSYRAGALGYRDALAAPHTTVKIPTNRWPVKSSQQHEDRNLHAEAGMPAPYDNGVMRFAWLSVLLTNWMGDDGFLRRLSVRIQEPNLYGDVTWYEATITGTTHTANGLSVAIVISGRNQMGQTTTSAKAEILLPIWMPEPQQLAGSAVAASHAPPPALLAETREPQAPAAGYEAANSRVPVQGIHHLIERQAGEIPEATALRFEDKSLTYQQLNEQANRLARYLLAKGVRPQALVGICLERSPEMVLSILAVLKAGATYVPLDPRYPQERLALMLADAGVALLLSQTEVRPHLPPSAVPLVVLDREWERISQQQAGNLALEVAAGQLAYVLYTSGSTGAPKGVCVPHASLVSYVEELPRPLGISREDTYLHTASFSFSASGRQMMLPLSLGATLVLANEAQTQDPIALFRLMAGEQVTIWDTVPTFWRHCIDQLLQLPAADRRALLENQLRLILATGEALDWSIPQAWQQELRHQARLVNLYSLTETAGTVACYPIPEDTRGRSGTVPLGWPIGRSTIYILDEHLQPLAAGNSGELFIGGARLARGYLNRPNLTAGNFLPDPFQGSPGSTLYRTGDLARSLPDGSLASLGRADRRVKVRGFRIELGEVEAALRQHPAVANAVVTAQEEGGRLVAYVVASQEQPPTVSELHTFLKAKLPDYMVPATFLFLSALPLTPNGKLDRSAFPEPEHSRPNLESHYEAPRSPVESALVRLFAEILNLDRVGIDDDFFELGGHSLLAFQVVARLAEVYDYAIELRLDQLFQYPTVAALAPTVEEQLTAGKSGQLKSAAPPENDSS